jgi:ribosomal protein L7/L12
MVACGLLLVAPWRAAEAAPVVFEKATANGSSADDGRFTAVLAAAGSPNQALLQLFTAAAPGARITGLYLQDGTGAIAGDAITGAPLVQLSQTQLYEVLLNDPGPNKVAVIKALTTALGIGLTAAKARVDEAPSVIRASSNPDGLDKLQQSLEEAGAKVMLTSRADPSTPAGANVGVTTPGGTPTGYDVVLSRAGANKVALIKLVRDLTGLGLTESKKLVDDAPSVLKTNVSPAEALALRQELQDTGATVELKPIGGTVSQGPIILPPGSTGFAPGIEVAFQYQDPDATPALQLTLDLDIAYADLVAAWEDGAFVLGLKVTDAAGFSDLYLVAPAVAPVPVSEPPTVALLSLPLLGLLLASTARRKSLKRAATPICSGLM